MVSARCGGRTPAGSALKLAAAILAVRGMTRVRDLSDELGSLKRCGR
jgi:Mg-chelatase subunit ChlD